VLRDPIFTPLTYGPPNLVTLWGSQKVEGYLNQLNQVVLTRWKEVVRPFLKL